MRNVLAFVFLATLVSGMAEAQTFVESQHVFDEGYSPKLAGQMVQPGKKVTYIAWFAVSETWGEGLFGASKSFKPWLNVGLVAGFETNPRPMRLSPQVWVGTKKASAFTVLEFGGSGWWYKSMGGVKVSDKVEIGYHSQRFYGTGPMVRVMLPARVSAWISVVPGPKATIGVRKFF